MTKTIISLLLAVTLTLAAAVSARAEIWPGSEPSPGGAIAAKVIGELCPGILGKDEIGVLTGYITRRAREFEAGTPEEQRYPGFFIKLEAAYKADYASGERCGEAAAELALDMLKRVRKVMSPPAN